MNDLLNEERFAFISAPDRAFMLAFNERMAQLGYDYGGQIGSGYCWGKYMLIYTKTGAASKTVYARIYMRDDDIVLRLFLNNVDKHRAFIERAPGHIKEVFTGEFGRCGHCHNEKGGTCRFRKIYTIDGELIEKCNGLTFWFHRPSTASMDDYMALFSEFFPGRRAAKN